MINLRNRKTNDAIHYSNSDKLGVAIFWLLIISAMIVVFYKPHRQEHRGDYVEIMTPSKEVIKGEVEYLEKFFKKDTVEIKLKGDDTVYTTDMSNVIIKKDR